MKKDIIFWVFTASITGIAIIIWTYRKEVYNFLKRNYLKLFPVAFNVAFSIKSEEGLNSGEYFKELLKNFNKILEIEDLTGVVKVRNLSDIYLFSSRNEAEKFSLKKEIDLMVWGDFSNDVLKKAGKGKMSKLNLKFTYSILDNGEGSRIELVQRDLLLKMKEKNSWTIYDENSYDDIILVSNSLSDMSLYILSVSLMMQGDILKSTEILEKHKNNLLKRNDDFVRHVKHHLANNYRLLIENIV